MFNTGKCPACNKPVLGANVERININAVPGGATWVGVSYVCQNLNCQTVLGVSIDPIALKTDLVKELGKLITGK